MVIWSDLSWSETWIISRYKNRLGCCDKSMTCVQTNALGDAICENVLQVRDIGAPKPRFWRGPDQLQLAGTRENDQPAGEIWKNELLCWSQNRKNSKDCLHKLTSCIKSWYKSGPETLWFVKEFLESWHLPLRELNFGRQNSESTVQGIGQRKKNNNTGFRLVTLWCKNDDSKPDKDSSWTVKQKGAKQYHLDPT